MEVYFIGHTTAASSDYADYLTEPKAPKNYKSAEAINDYIEKARSEQLATASASPFTAVVDSVYVVPVKNGVAGESKLFTGLNAAVDFLNFIGDSVGESNFVAFNVKSFMTLAAVQALRNNPGNKTAQKWMLRDSDLRKQAINLPKLFLPTLQEQSRIGIAGLFKYYGVKDFDMLKLSDVEYQAKALLNLSVATGINLQEPLGYRDSSEEE